MLIYNDIVRWTPNFFESDDYIIHTLKKNVEGYLPNLQTDNPYDKYSFKINSSGFRGSDIDFKKENNILILGDSQTFGVYLNDNETFPYQLEMFLNKKNNNSYQVINAGYSSGFCPDQHYLWLKRNIKKYKIKFVIYNFVLNNDLRCIDKKKWVQIDSNGLPLKLEDKTLRVDNGRLITTIQRDDSVGNQFCYKNKIFRNLYTYTSICRIIRKFYKTNKNQNINKQKFHQFEWVHIYPSTNRMIKKEKKLIKLIKGMKALSDDNDINFFLVAPPINYQYDPEKFLDISLPNYSDKDKEIKRYYTLELSSILNNFDIKLIDFMNIFKKNSFLNPYPLNGENHMTPNGQY